MGHRKICRRPEAESSLNGNAGIIKHIGGNTGITGVEPITRYRKALSYSRKQHSVGAEQLPLQTRPEKANRIGPKALYRYRLY